MIKNVYFYHFLLFITCVVSRIITSIFYIEDIDSLRFALSLIDYDISKLQPHFPGYFVHHIIIKPIYLLTSNTGLSFGIVGGLSIYICILSLLKIFSVSLNSQKGLFITLFIFFNPLIWLMSNRYMPDILGLAFLSLSFYYLINFQNNFYLGPLFFGLLSGLRLSYIPFLIFPLYECFTKTYHKKKYVFTIIFGILIWLLPLVLTTGLKDFLTIAMNQSQGHFYDFGGTIISNNNFFERISNFFMSIWADGMGGYARGRSVLSLLISILLSFFLINIINVWPKVYKNNLFKVLFISIMIYSLWIFFFQNIIYKSRHVLPLVLFLIPVMILSVFQFKQFNKSLRTILLSLFLTIQSILTIILTIQHKEEPSAIFQVKEFVTENSNNKTIVSIPLINFYLKSHGINSTFIDIDDKNFQNKIEINNNHENIILIGEFLNIIDNKNEYLKSDTSFYHNPFVNKMWSEITVYSLSEKK